MGPVLESIIPCGCSPSCLLVPSSDHRSPLIEEHIQESWNISLGVVGIRIKEYITACEHQFDSIRPTSLRTHLIVDSTDATSAIAGSPLLKRQMKEPID